MLSKSDEDILNERLHNWGRWAADRKLSGSSFLWRMMQKYGKKDPQDMKYEEPKEVIPPLDPIDAVKVNRAWQSLPESPHRYHCAKWVVVAHYCYPNMLKRIACKQLHIGVKDYDQLLELAKYMLFNRLEQHASKRLSASD
jgi:hypothetical protein